MTTAVVVRRDAGFAWQIPFSRMELACILGAMRAACGLERMELDVTLTDDAFIAEVNAGQLGCAGPTNILSFPPFSGDESVSGRGSLLLSLDALQRECLLYGQDAAEHAVRLFSHGMAHLAGLDHSDAMDFLQEQAFTAGRAAWATFAHAG